MKSRTIVALFLLWQMLFVSACSGVEPTPFLPALLTFVGLSVFATLIGLGLNRWYQRSMATREIETQHLIRQRTVEIERRRQIAEGLREILVILNSERSLGESLHYIASQAARLTDAEDAILFRTEPEQPMTIVATNPGGHIRYKPGETLLMIVREWMVDDWPQKRPLVVPELARFWQTHPDLEPSTLTVYQALLGVPVSVADEVYGGLLLFYTHPRSFSDEDLDLGSTFADQTALAVANAQLRERVEETAVAAERNRLARDLHDAVTQTLFSASLIAESLPSLWEMDPDEGRNMLFDLQKLTRGALAEMRTLLLELRPTALANARLDDLLQQLATAVTGRSGIPVTVGVDRLGKLPIAVRVALYRIAQEALNNVVKHARATQVMVHLQQSDNGQSVVLRIEDDGRGFDPDQVPVGRLGLGIMQERAQTIGARLTMETTAEKGTLVTAVWPAERSAQG